MKVLLLAENWKPRVGGIERYLEGITGALSEQGFQVEVVAPKNRRFFWPVVKPAWLPLFIFLWRKAKRNEFQVLLCGKALFEGLVGYYLKKRLGIPFIVFTYAMEIDVWQKDDVTWRKLVRVLKGADRVVYINEVTKKRLQELGVRDEQLLKVQPGVSIQDTVSSKQYAGKRYVLSVGRLIQRKGFDTLIEAISQLDQTRFGDVELWIAGDGPDKKRLMDLAEAEYLIRSATELASPSQGEAPLLTKERSIGDRVRFLGQVPDEELQRLYAGAEVFALTPRNLAGDIEGFGIVYLEAALHSVPAVATKVGGVSEAVIQEETGILVEPDSPAAVAVALSRLLANREQRDRLGNQARLRVQEEFTWTKRAEPLTQALKKLTE
ncbi:MAG: glycosyltransferase family 4 protein [Patescibacteria group bacterium]